jgi:hypothetical protein
MPAIVCNASFSTTDVPKKAEFDSECLCFDEFPVRRFELAAKVQTEKLLSDLQDAEYLFVADFNFQLKCVLLVGGQDRAYSFKKCPKSRKRCTTFTKVRAL